MKKILLNVLLFLSILAASKGISTTVYAYAGVNADRAAFSQPNCKAALLVEMDTGKILYQYHKDLPLPQASITKLMTYYTMKTDLEKRAVDETSKVIIQKASFHLPSDGVQFGLHTGEKYSYQQLFRTMLVISANDIACEFQTLYDSTGKGKGNNTSRNFIKVMNDNCKRLKLTETSYINPTGITEKRGYNKSSAYDLYQLSKAIITKYPDILKYTSQKEIWINGKKFSNTNELLHFSPEVDGLKTGHTNEAGYCLVFTADEKKIIGNGKPMRLIGIVLGCKSKKDREKVCQKLLRYGEVHFYNRKLIDSNHTYTFKNIYYKKDIMGQTQKNLYLLLPKSTIAQSKFVPNLALSGTIHKGSAIGTLYVNAEDKQYRAVVYAANTYTQKFILLRILLRLSHFIDSIF